MLGGGCGVLSLTQPHPHLTTCHTHLTTCSLCIAAAGSKLWTFMNKLDHDFVNVSVWWATAGQAALGRSRSSWLSPHLPCVAAIALCRLLAPPRPQPWLSSASLVPQSRVDASHASL